MPANYRERLSDSELDDLVSFLTKAPNPSRTAKPERKKNEDEDDFE